MKIAVVGGGIAGLMAAYLLRRQHQVTLFEAAPRLGGHTHTVEVEDDSGFRRPIDMGFIVCNDRNYPHFLRLLAELGVGLRASSMSFSVRCEQTGFEYNGTTLNSLFAQRRNLLSMSFYSMLLGILRFHRLAPGLRSRGAELTLRQMVHQHRLSRPFVERYLVPMTAAIWSTDGERVLDYPAATLISFLDNHGMLAVGGRPQWRVVEGGSQTYVRAMARILADRVRLGCPIRALHRLGQGVELQLADGTRERFDRAVLAVHSDQALTILADPSDAEVEILGAIPYQDNDVVLHTDTSFLPRRRLARASWNYHLGTGVRDAVQVTYWMNCLQGFTAEKDYCVTLNRTAEIDPETILARRSFAHPLYTRAGIRAQERWREINGVRDTYYCGAYWGHGFHEDGVRSALRVASALGCTW